MRTRGNCGRVTSLAACAVAAALLRAPSAAALPGDVLLTGARASLHTPADPARSAVTLVSRDPAVAVGAAGGSEDPTLAGASLRIWSSAGETFGLTYALPAERWKPLAPLGGRAGYGYSDPKGQDGPVRKVVLREGRLVRVRIRGGPAIPLASDPDPINAALSIGGRRLCVSFGGRVSFRAGRRLSARAAPRSWGCEPVRPTYSESVSDFEGFEVRSYVPAAPAGLAFVFHGSGGSARFVDKIETVDFLDHLVARGWGFVATESTQRVAPKRWNVQDPSLVTNPDLARLLRLRDHLIATSAITAATPLAGVGMSNGARFVSLWGETWAAAGLPVRAVVMSMGRLAPPVVASGGPTVPTLFVIAENDQTVDNAQIEAQQAAAEAAGLRTGLLRARETTLEANRLLRIAGLDSPIAAEVFAAAVASGIWNEAGERIVPIDQAAAGLASIALPPSASPFASSIGDEVQAVLALHQFTAEFAREMTDFLVAP